MRSLPSFDRAYPVRTLYTDNEDWRRCEGWQDADRRRAALQDYLRVPLKQVVTARETHSGSVYAVSSESGESLAVRKETYVTASSVGYDALVTDIAGILRDRDDPRSLISSISESNVSGYRLSSTSR